jgi:hypothetical protein
MAWEQDPNNHIAVRYFANRASLLAANPTRSFDTPMTLSACAEGTPNIYSVKLKPDIDHSFIDIGGHYFRDCQADRQQRGNLTNFSHWVTSSRPDVDNAILFWGVQGNIGDRDAVTFGGFQFQLMEGQSTFGDFGSFRTFLYDFSTGNADRVNITTARGSTAFANRRSAPSKRQTARARWLLVCSFPVRVRQLERLGNSSTTASSER